MALGRIIGGTAAAGLGLVGLGYAGLAGQDDTTRNESGEITESGELGALRIRVGDCFGDVPEGGFESVEAVPCSEPHMHEVFAAFLLDGDDDAAYPGLAAVEREAGDGCLARFEPFVGLDYESSVYGIAHVTPTEVSWEEVDDREVLCLIGNYDGTSKTGSAEGTGR